MYHHRFLGDGEEDRITAPIPPRALVDDRRPEPRDFSGFYYASPELRCHDGVTSKPFVKKISVEHDYQTIDVEQQAVAIRQAMEEQKVIVYMFQCFHRFSVVKQFEKRSFTIVFSSRQQDSRVDTKVELSRNI